MNYQPPIHKVIIQTLFLRTLRNLKNLKGLILNFNFKKNLKYYATPSEIERKWYGEKSQEK